MRQDGQTRNVKDKNEATQTEEARGKELVWVALAAFDRLHLFLSDPVRKYTNNRLKSHSHSIVRVCGSM